MKFTKYHRFAASYWYLGASLILLFASMLVLEPRPPSSSIVAACALITLPFAVFCAFGLRYCIYRLRRMEQIRSGSTTTRERGNITHRVTPDELDEIAELWGLEIE